MTLLPGKTFVTCPKTGSEVNVKTVCVECEDFKHVSYEGNTPLIACNHENEPEPEQSNVPHGTMKKKGIGTLKRW